MSLSVTALGAQSVTRYSAILRGSIEDGIDFFDTYWGTEDGGTNPASWQQHSKVNTSFAPGSLIGLFIGLGNINPSPPPTLFPALRPATLYFFRFRVTSGPNTAWSDPPALFFTSPGFTASCDTGSYSQHPLGRRLSQVNNPIQKDFRQMAQSPCRTKFNTAALGRVFEISGSSRSTYQVTATYQGGNPPSGSVSKTYRWTDADSGLVFATNAPGGSIAPGSFIESINPPELQLDYASGDYFKPFTRWKYKRGLYEGTIEHNLGNIRSIDADPLILFELAAHPLSSTPFKSQFNSAFVVHRQRLPAGSSSSSLHFYLRGTCWWNFSSHLAFLINNGNGVGSQLYSQSFTLRHTKSG